MTSFRERQHAVWLVTPEWYGQGGVGDYTHFLACHLVRLGYSVAVFGPPCRVPFAETPYTRREVPGAWSLRALLHLVRLAQDERPDVVHLQFVPHGFQSRGLPTPLSFLPLLLRLSGASRPVITFHELFISWEAKIIRRILGFFQRLQALLLASGSCAIIVTLEGRAAWLCRWLPHKRSNISVIPVGSNIQPVSLSSGDRSALRRQFFGSDDVFVLGTFSPRHPAIDLKGVITALTYLPTDVHLLVIGRVSPVRRLALHEHATALGVAQRVFWTGSLTELEVSHALQALDAYVHPHPSGPSPRSTALAAALAHGLPVIAYAGFEDVAQTYRPGHHLLVVQPSNPYDLAAAVKRLRSEPSLCQSLRAQGKRHYDQYHSWQTITALTSSAYLQQTPSCQRK